MKKGQRPFTHEVSLDAESLRRWRTTAEVEDTTNKNKTQMPVTCIFERFESGRSDKSSSA
jgi:hypothetical protein